MSDRGLDRRRFLHATGMAALAGLAGCTSDTAGSDGDGEGGGGGDTPESTPMETPDSTPSDGGDGGDGGTPITVGVLLPFTGEYDWVGSNVFPVAEMIAQEINEGGGIDGRPIELVKGDTEGTVDASITATQKLVNVDKVAGIIGPTSLTFTGVIDLIRENRVPVVSPTAGTTELNTVGGKYIFRTVPSDSLGGRAISKAARNEQFNGVASYERMALMVGKAPALQSFKKPIGSSFEEFGGSVATTLDYATGKSSYQSEVSKVLGADPELIALIGSPEDSAKIMRAAFQAGYEGNWFVTQDQTNETFLDLVDPKITDGILGLQEADSPEAKESGRIEEFTARFRSYAGKKPGLFAKNTYDAANVLGLAMKATAVAGKPLERPAIAANIRTVANPPDTAVTDYSGGATALEDGADIDYEGLVGPVNFDENGDITSPFAIMRAQGETWKRVALLPASELS